MSTIYRRPAELLGKNVFQMLERGRVLGQENTVTGQRTSVDLDGDGRSDVDIVRRYSVSATRPSVGALGAASPFTPMDFFSRGQVAGLIQLSPHATYIFEPGAPPSGQTAVKALRDDGTITSVSSGQDGANLTLRDDGSVEVVQW